MFDISIESINPVSKESTILLEKEPSKLPNDGPAQFQQQQNEEKVGTQQEFTEAIRQINQTMEIYHTELRFVLHEASGEIMVQVVKSETGEVIREIPPEYVLKIVSYVKEMLGLLLDKLV